jgi:redox-sensitive bicupin YhaK (pirin superfamily)/predicted transcriptional regulator
MNARDVMTSPVIAVRPGESLREAARTLVERRLSAMPVMEGERLVGIVSEADVLRELPAGGAREVREVMTSDVATVTPDTAVEDVAELLAARRIRRVPVVEGERVVGMVSRTSLVHALAVRPRGEDDAGARIAMLERLGGEAWWRGGDSLDAQAPAAGPTYGVRRAAERGRSRQGWADTYYSFSFGGYYDPAYLAYGPLQAINEKVLLPAGGSTTHGLRDVEVVTYVIDGVLGHENSLDETAALVPGAVHCLSAGAGVRFSEVNASTAAARFLQMWFDPERTGLPAAAACERYPASAKRGRLQPVVTRDGREGSLRIRQDALLYAGLFDGAESARLDIASGRSGYVQVARGALEVCGEALGTGDGFAVRGGTGITLEGGREAEVLVFDLPAGG